MQEQQESRWKLLCELASKEHDPDKLLELIHEINELIEAKRVSLNNEQAHGKDSVVPDNATR
jgi:hypothetical protein